MPQRAERHRAEIAAEQASDSQLEGLRQAMLSMVSDAASPDLSARQLAVLLLIVAHGETSWTVRGLSAEMKVQKPAITRALDRLEDSRLAQRFIDPHDRRSVIVEPTRSGSALVHRLAEALAQHAIA